MAIKEVLEKLKTTGNYNRIINLTLYNARGKKVQIRCPTRGRKPSIEITGTFTSKCELSAFNITLKNLYLDLLSDQYTRVQVEAGYEGNTITFEGNIIMLYPEGPGPEGTTVIQCKQGEVDNYLDAMVQLNFNKGVPLATVLKEIAARIGANGVHMGLRAASLFLQDPLQYDDAARNAMNYLERLFESENLNIFMRSNTLCAICLKQGDFIKSHKLQYISSPPQPNVGGADGTNFSTITAPWEPKLQRGDNLIIPARIYQKYGVLVNALNKRTQTIQVTQLSFHFSTTGNTNSMNVQGFLVR